MEAFFAESGQLFEAQTYDRCDLMCDERGPLALTDELLLDLLLDLSVEKCNHL